MITTDPSVQTRCLPIGTARLPRARCMKITGEALTADATRRLRRWCRARLARCQRTACDGIGWARRAQSWTRTLSSRQHPMVSRWTFRRHHHHCRHHHRRCRCHRHRRRRPMPPHPPTMSTLQCCVDPKTRGFWLNYLEGLPLGHTKGGIYSKPFVWPLTASAKVHVGVRQLELFSLNKNFNKTELAILNTFGLPPTPPTDHESPPLSDSIPCSPRMPSTTQLATSWFVPLVAHLCACPACWYLCS